MNEIKIGDKVIWIENGIEETIILTPAAFYYYTLVPKGFVEIKQWEEQK